MQHHLLPVPGSYAEGAVESTSDAVDYRPIDLPPGESSGENSSVEPAGWAQPEESLPTPRFQEHLRDPVAEVPQVERTEVRHLRLADGPAARLDGIEPYAYLRGLFVLLPDWPRNRVLKLAPKFWK